MVCDNNIPTFASSYSAHSEKSYAQNAERNHFVDRALEGRLHKYLKELRKGMNAVQVTRNEGEMHSMFNKVKPKHNGSSKRQVAADSGGRYTEDQWKRMMRLHGTSAPSNISERKSDKWRQYNDPCIHLTSSMSHHVSGLENILHDDIYEHDSSESEDVCRLRLGRNPHFTTKDIPSARDDEIDYMDMLDQISVPSFQEYSEPDVSVKGYRKFSDITDATTPSRRITKNKFRIYGHPSVADETSLSEDPNRHECDANNREEHFDEEGYRDQAKLLRNIADQIEVMANYKMSRINHNDEKCIELSNQLCSQNEELVELRHKVAKYEEMEREMHEKIDELEIQLRRAQARGGVGDVSLDDGVNSVNELEGAETLPPVILETRNLDTKTQTYVSKLRTILYAGLEHSLSIAFQADLYRALHELPETVHCRDIVQYVNECIAADSDVLHTWLRQSALRHGTMRIFVEGHISPFTNRYPFPPEFEQRVIAEMEASHPMRRFSMNIQHTHELQREEKGIVMNRLVLRSIFKYSHINNLYNYLFTALYRDNFRVVDILMDAVGAKFLDFQMAPMYNKRFRHPLMWSFGDACNATQAYRYMKELNFDFALFPLDPNDGENLWHRVVKGGAVRVAQSLKAYMLYTEFLNHNDQRGTKPLEIATGKIRKELLTLAVVDVATKGSELYKKNDFEAALRLYSEAIEKQIEALSIDGEDKDRVCYVNLGKLYYNKARSLIHLNRWTETVEACELCVEHIPSYTNAYVTCIQAYEKLLDWENAVKMCCLMGENCGVVDDDKMESLRSQLGATMFQILGLPNSATPREVRQAFNQLCKQWHPDKVGLNMMKSDLKRRSMNQFNRIYDAREKLLDDNTRCLEKQRPETQYKAPEPITESEQNTSERGRKISVLEPLTSHLSKLKDSSQEDSTVDNNLLQTAVDRLQQQIDEMDSKT